MKTWGKVYRWMCMQRVRPLWTLRAWYFRLHNLAAKVKNELATRALIVWYGTRALVRALLWKAGLKMRCEHEGCSNLGQPCYLPHWSYDLPYNFYCPEHMYENGYCPGCLCFWAGVEAFDFSPVGLCPNCRDEYDDREEFCEEWGPEEWDGPWDYADLDTG